MAKNSKSINKKYAKLSAHEAEAKQQIANRRERLRQSNVSEAFKTLENALPANNNGAKRSHLSILLEAADRIQDLERQLKNALTPVTKLSPGQQDMSSLSSPLTWFQSDTLDTQPLSHDSSSSHQSTLDTQPLSHDSSSSQQSTLDTQSWSHDSYASQHSTLNTQPLSHDSYASQHSTLDTQRLSHDSSASQQSTLDTQRLSHDRSASQQSTLDTQPLNHDSYASQHSTLDTQRLSHDSSASQHSTLDTQRLSHDSSASQHSTLDTQRLSHDSSASQHSTLDTQRLSHDRSASQQPPQQYGYPQYNYSNNHLSQFNTVTTGADSCRYQTVRTISHCNTAANLPHGGQTYQPYLPMDKRSIMIDQYQVFPMASQSDRPRQLSSCRFQPYSIGPARTDYMYVGTQAPHTQTSATRFPAASTTNQFQPAPTDYTSCLYRQF